MKKKNGQTVIVSFLDADCTAPDCIWIYFHKPMIGDKAYGSLYGYWDDGKSVEVKKSPFYLLDYKTFKKQVLPEKYKEYATMQDFEKEMFTNRL